jgi:hypothetical protein
MAEQTSANAQHPEIRDGVRENRGPPNCGSSNAELRRQFGDDNRLFYKDPSVEASPLRVRGLVTGRSYEFTSSQPVQSVDARDAASLLNTRYFRRVDNETEPS